MPKRTDSYQNDGYEIKYENLPSENEIVYDVVDKKDGHKYSLTISARGWAHLFCDDEKIVSVSVKLDPFLKNIGGAEQYQFVEKDLDIKNIEGVMELYRKVKTGDCTIFPNIKKGKLFAAKRSKTKILDFMDKYLFNTPESRAILNEYMNKHVVRAMAFPSRER